MLKVMRIEGEPERAVLWSVRPPSRRSREQQQRERESIRPSPLAATQRTIPSLFLLALSWPPSLSAMFDFEQDPEESIETWCFCGNRIVQPKLALRKDSAGAGSSSSSLATVKGAPGKYITPQAPSFKLKRNSTVKVRFLCRLASHRGVAGRFGLGRARRRVKGKEASHLPYLRRCLRLAG